jgi:2-polyprenyl-6-methoxyphenol hydroxylase-like FAD-dependent oxidoreductase
VRRTTMQTMKIGIIGGSIAGCCAAIELTRRGFDVTVFERSGDELKDRGAGIGVPSGEFDTFIARDLVDADIPNISARSFSRIWRTDEESRLGYLAWDQPANLAALNWGALYRNLRDRVDDEHYLTRQHVVALHQSGNDGAVVELADGSTATFDLVVCADGYASLGRSTLFPEIELAYAGYVLWRGFIAEDQLEDAAALENGIRCVGHPGGHGIFYFVPGPGDVLERGSRLVNWGVYCQVPAAELAAFMTDRSGQQHQGSLPPGSMPPDTEQALKAAARRNLPSYYADITDKSPDTFAYAIYDCEVPAYVKGRICLAGDAGAFARPHSGAGALKGMNDMVSLGAALASGAGIDEALAMWNTERTTANNNLVRFGNQLGRALVEEIPDWSQLDAAGMQKWYTSIVTIKSDYIHTRR